MQIQNHKRELTTLTNLIEYCRRKTLIQIFCHASLVQDFPRAISFNSMAELGKASTSERIIFLSSKCEVKQFSEICYSENTLLVRVDSMSMQSPFVFEQMESAELPAVHIDISLEEYDRLREQLDPRLFLIIDNQLHSEPPRNYIERLLPSCEDGSIIVMPTFAETAEEVVNNLRDIDLVFTDLDGTQGPHGFTSFPPHVFGAIKRVLKKGVKINSVTGKPTAEIVPILDQIRSLDHVEGFRVVAEKGAYIVDLSSDDNDVLESYLLSNERLTDKVSRAREIIMSREFLSCLEEKYGVTLIPAGSGQHKSMISFDIVGFDKEIPEDICINWNSYNRDSYKVSRLDYLSYYDSFAEDIRLKLVNSFESRLDFKVIDLGNANIEISIRSDDSSDFDVYIDKGEAFNRLLERDYPKGYEGKILILGDSPNDLSFLDSRHPDVIVGMVLHVNEDNILTAEELLDLHQVDFWIVSRQESPNGRSFGNVALNFIDVFKDECRVL